MGSPCCCRRASVCQWCGARACEACDAAVPEPPVVPQIFKAEGVPCYVGLPFDHKKERKLIMDESREGKTAYIRYKGGVQGERPADDRSQGEPLAVKIGASRLPKGIDDALMRMEVGESCTLIIPPEEGYGNADPKLVQWYPRMLLDHGYEIKDGSMIMWESADGLAKRPAMVVESTKDNVKIDLNHPYAGKTLEYWVELVDVR